MSQLLLTRARAIQRLLEQETAGGCRALEEWIENERAGAAHTIEYPEQVVGAAGREMPPEDLIRHMMRQL